MVAYKQHPFSAAWPAMEDAAFAELCADIKANGLHMPIILHDRKILDGWHRQRACLKTGLPPRYQEFRGDAAAARRFVVSANRVRRHLTTSQLAIVAATLTTSAAGRPKDVALKGANLPVSHAIDRVAEQFNLSPRTVKDARVVLNSRKPELIEQVRNNEVSVSRAARDIRADRAITLKIVPEPRPDQVITPKTVQVSSLHVPAPLIDLPMHFRKEALTDLARLKQRHKRAFGLDDVWHAVEEAQLVEAQRAGDNLTSRNVEQSRLSQSISRLETSWRLAPEEARRAFLRNIRPQLTPEMRADVMRFPTEAAPGCAVENAPPTRAGVPAIIANPDN